MKRAVLLLVLPLVLACARQEEAPMEDTAVESAAPAMNYAGNWAVNSMPEVGDTVLVTYEMVATNDQTGWTVTLPGRETRPVRVISISADSVVTEADPFESVLRPGVMVTTRTTLRPDGDRLVGTTIARYSTTDADSVTTLRVAATRR
jgi:hypothetical protein